MCWRWNQSQRHGLEAIPAGKWGAKVIFSFLPWRIRFWVIEANGSARFLRLSIAVSSGTAIRKSIDFSLDGCRHPEGKCQVNSGYACTDRYGIALAVSGLGYILSITRFSQPQSDCRSQQSSLRVNATYQNNDNAGNLSAALPCILQHCQWSVLFFANVSFHRFAWAIEDVKEDFQKIIDVIAAGSSRGYLCWLQCGRCSQEIAIILGYIFATHPGSDEKPRK